MGHTFGRYMGPQFRGDLGEMSTYRYGRCPLFEVDCTLIGKPFFFWKCFRFITRKLLVLSLFLMSPEHPHLKQYRNGRTILIAKSCYLMDLLFLLYY